MEEHKYLTEKQKLAIKNLKKAISDVGKCGISLFGMDCDILYVTNAAMKECKEKDESIGTNYNPAADTYRVLQYNIKDNRIGTIISGKTYIDSGGW